MVPQNLIQPRGNLYRMLCLLAAYALSQQSLSYAPAVPEVITVSAGDIRGN